MTIINTNSPTSPAVDTPQPATALTPEAVVEQLRTIRSQIGEVTPITSAQREAMRPIAKLAHEIIQSSVNMIDFSTPVQQALGRPTADVRDLQDANARWMAEAAWKRRHQFAGDLPDPSAAVRYAAGAPLPFTQDDIAWRGSAIDWARTCRSSSLSICMRM